jgi:DEAD/DEAH box helicase domain-containing protein
VIAPWEPILATGRPPEGSQLVARTALPGRRGRTAPLPEALAPRLREALAGAGIDRLYRHQADAFAAATHGDVAVVTGTASGKSLAFNLPVLDAVACDRHARAAYVYPTKALAQDQAGKLAALAAPNARPAIYDGDTPVRDRRGIRASANLVLTNPDMLHTAILPRHDLWGDFFANLRFVVIDEAHAYRGVFGSHVANVLARLRRVAAAYGAAPRFLLASATVANPAEAAAVLAGRPVTVVDRDGSPAAGREVVLWNPPLLDEAGGIRASTLGEAATLFAGLVARGLRTICFAKSRAACEIVFRYAREGLRRHAPQAAERIAPYRAGYTREQRRAIERRLLGGDLHGVVATSALELGIDVGLLDCAVTVGFPGTIASLTQQWGRAGRTGRGLGVLVASEDALDQYLCRHPDELLRRPVEAAVSNPANPHVLAGHLRAAAAELPLQDADAAHFGPGALALARSLPELLPTPRGLVYRGPDHPAGRVPLRSSSGDAVAVVESDTGALLGAVDTARAGKTVHPGAVYLHAGDAYLVSALDLHDRVALVAPFSGPYYTQPRVETRVAVRGEALAADRTGARVAWGEIEVRERVTGYQRRRLRDHEPIDVTALELPETAFATEAVWYVPDAPPVDARELLGSLHAAEHAMIGLLPLLATCDRWDIGGLSTDFHEHTLAPTVFVYDGHPGGVGIARRGYERFDEWVARTERLIADCPCRTGCPSCVQSPKCGNLNEPLAKEGARRLLAALIATGGRRNAVVQ